MRLTEPTSGRGRSRYSFEAAPQRPPFRLLASTLACVLLVSLATFAANSTKILQGSWSGKATGPQGGPPTGDIVVIMEKGPSGMKGTITVKAPGGAQYSGQVENIALKDGLFSATAIFKLGDNPLEAKVSGPLKGKTIMGTFTVLSRGQKMGDGTFTITKGPAPPKTR